MIIRIILLLLLLTAPFQVFSEAKSCTVGAVISLSGDMASYGHEMQRGMELKLKEESDCNIKILYGDDQSFNNAKALNAAKRLVESEGAKILFLGAVNTARALTQFVNKAKIPTVILWDFNEMVKNLGQNFSSIGYSTEGAGYKLAEFAHNKLKLQTSYIVSMQDEWSEGIANAFKLKLSSLGGKVVGEDSVLTTEADFKAIVTRIIKADPDCIYLPLNGSQGVTFIKQLRQGGYKGAALAADGLGQNEAKQLGNELGPIYVTQMILDDNNLIAKYHQEYGPDSDPVNLAFAALGYDAMQVAKRLCCNGEKLKTINPAEFQGKEETIVKIIDNKFEKSEAASTAG